jgi:hypothetical protein
MEEEKKEIQMSGSCVMVNPFPIMSMFRKVNESGELKKDKWGNPEMNHPKIVLIGRSGSGKSWAMREIMYKAQDIPAGIVIAPTDRLNKFWDDFIPSCYIYHEYRDTIIPKLLKRQMTMKEENRVRIEKGKRPKDSRAFLIMDDCMSSKDQWLKDPNVLSIMNEGRHYDLTYLLAMQYSLGIQPELRSNFNYVFLFNEEFRNNQDKLYTHYAGMFYNVDIFRQVFLQITENYGCMVINNQIQTRDLTKKVFFYRSKEVPKFMVGCEKYKEFNARRYNASGTSVKTVDWGSLGTKKNKPKIYVKMNAVN